MNMLPIENIVNSIKEFPTLPTIFTALQKAMSNPDTNIDYVASIIEKDQSSVTKLLKLSNSSIFGFRSRITSIHQAILYLGFEEVKNLLLTLKIIEIFRTKDEALKLIMPQDFWRHSIATGIISRFIGMNIGMRSSEILFISGVLHNLGRLLLLISYPDEYVEALKKHREERIPLIDAERKVFGISNAVVGEMLALKWKLPIQISDVIKNYFFGFIGDKVNLNVAIVHIADITASLFEFGSAGSIYIHKPNPDVWTTLSMPNNFFSSNIDRIKDEYEENCSAILNL
jgi:HD-like signal output (HDOD) protein